MAKYFAKAFLKLTGWKIKNDVNPEEITHGVLLFAPHTSFYDFYFGKAILTVLGKKAKLLIKKEVFVFPIKRWLKRIGGIPVDRSGRNNLVNDLISLFENDKHLILMIAPEGTRKPTSNWKKGFYYIATKVNVPVIISYLDYKTKTGGTKAVFYLSGNYEADMQKIASYYVGVQAKYPEKFLLPKQYTANL